MGNKQSSSIKQTMDVVTENMVNSMTEITNSQSQVIATNQTFNLTVNGTVDCRPGELQVIQENQTRANMEGVFSQVNEQEIQRQISSALDAASQSSNSAVTGFLSTKVGDSQSNVQEISQHIKTLVETNISNIVKNECTQTVATAQTNTIVVNGNIFSNGCRFTQSIQLELSIRCMGDFVASLIEKDEILNTAVNKAAAANDSVATGPISEFFAGLSGLWGTLLLPLIIGAVVIGLVLVVRASSKSKAKASKQAGRDMRRIAQQQSSEGYQQMSSYAPEQTQPSGYYQQYQT